MSDSTFGELFVVQPQVRSTAGMKRGVSWFDNRPSVLIRDAAHGPHP